MFGTPGEPDPRVAPLLDELGIAYNTDSDGDYKLILDVAGDERTQLVIINSRTRAFGELELRDVWSVAYIADGPLPAEMANELLQHGSDVAFGGWRSIVRDTGEHVVAFAAQVTADTDADTLRQILDAVLTASDAMEQRLTGRDDF